MELVNTPDQLGTWLPRTQRFEWQGKPQGIAGASPALRITSQFHERKVVLEEAGASDTIQRPAAFTLLRGDQGLAAAATRTGTEPLGQETVQFQESDFFGLNPYRPVLTGKSRVTLLVPDPGREPRALQPGRGHLHRHSRHLHPGRQAAEHVLPRNVGVPGLDRRVQVRCRRWAGTTDRRGWSCWAAAISPVTNKFRTQFDSYALGALFSRDNWDYVDRYVDQCRGDPAAWRSPADRACRSRRAGPRTSRSSACSLTDPWVGYLRPNRGIYAGSYFRTTGDARHQPRHQRPFRAAGLGIPGAL